MVRWRVLASYWSSSSCCFYTLVASSVSYRTLTTRSCNIPVASSACWWDLASHRRRSSASTARGVSSATLCEAGWLHPYVAVPHR